MRTRAAEAYVRKRRSASASGEAMLGAADKRELGGNADGVVTFTEAVRYVKSTVPGDGKPNDKVQFPTAAPAELLPLVEIPLTSSRGR